MEYKVGDRVRIVSEAPKGLNWVNGMDAYFGKVMTIKSVFSRTYRMAEDKGKWFWGDSIIAGLASEVPFDFGAWKDKNVCMRCKTKEEAEDFCREMDVAGLRWRSGTSYLPWDYFELYEEQTCYCFNKGTYESTGRAKNKGYQILEWSDYRSTEPKEEQEKIMETKIDDRPLSFTEAMRIKKRICETASGKCENCYIASDMDCCNDFFMNYTDNAESILKKWATEHPAKTNRDKFAEVFGKCEFVICSVVPCSNCDWWDQEYVEPFEGKE